MCGGLPPGASCCALELSRITLKLGSKQLMEFVQGRAWVAGDLAKAMSRHVLLHVLMLSLHAGATTCCHRLGFGNQSKFIQ